MKDAFRDESGRLLLSRTTVSEIGARLWADYQEFARRDLSEYDITYLCPGWSHHTPRSRRPRPNLGTEIFIPVTNLLERLFVEERRRLKIIPNAFGEKPVLKLMFGAMIRAAERWRAIKVTEFERGQLAAVSQRL